MTDADTPRLAVFVSGNGSNLQAVLDACSGRRLAATVAVVVSNNPDAYALVRARQAGVPTEIRPHKGTDRAEYDRELAYTIGTYGVDLVVLAGWNRILTSHFVGHHRTINLHPAKPGGFRGLGAIEAISLRGNEASGPRAV